MVVDEQDNPSEFTPREAELQRQRRDTQPTTDGERCTLRPEQSSQHGEQQEASLQHSGSTYGKPEHSQHRRRHH
ncbi:hypothetical protein Bca4012_050983 [Brassica carinata]